MTHDAQLSERIEMEVPHGLTNQLSANVLRQCFRFPQSKLGGRWAGLARLCIDHLGAIAKRPKARMVWHGHCSLNNHSSPLALLDWKGFDEWIGRCAGRPYECFGGNLSVAQNHDAGSSVGQTRVQAERHAPLFHPLQRIT